MEIESDELQSKLERIRLKLFQAREERVRPWKDDKILTDWNGLMIAALARAGRVYQEKRYTEAAINAVDFIKDKLYFKGKLKHRYRDGEVKVEGYLEDYAFLIWGLLELYQTTLDSKYLKLADELNQILLDNYWDSSNGGFYLTSEELDNVLMRKKDAYDSAIPSGNGVSLLNLQVLSSLLEDQNLNEKAIQQEKAFATLIKQIPTGHAVFLVGIINRIGPFHEVVIASEDEKAPDLINIFNGNYLPRAVYSLNSPGDEWLKSKVETFPDKKPVDGKSTAYVCRQGVCGLPTTDPVELMQILQDRRTI